MRNIGRLLRVACISLFVTCAQAQPGLTLTVKPPSWKTISTSNQDRTVEAIFRSDQGFVAVLREWKNGQPVGVIGQSARGLEWNFSYADGAPSTELFASAQSESILVVVPWNRITFQIAAPGGAWSTVASPANKIDGEQAMVFALS